ncbi:uncharacterized protein METZ01_LOCUS419203, partial [marine metagenome]
TITYGGSCSSSTTSATADSNTITLNSLSDGTYSNCNITVTDSTGNVSDALSINSFIIEGSPATLFNESATLVEVTPVTTPSNDNTPNYTFSSSKAGVIVYSGSCYSDSSTASAGSNTITFSPLGDGAYSNCAITVYDSGGNNETLNISSFVIDTTPPTLAEVTSVENPSNDNTPDYTFASTEAGTITYSGSCSSSDTAANAGSNTITINSLTEGTYSNCTITVTDSAGNANSSIMSSFVVDTSSGGGTDSGSPPGTLATQAADFTFISADAV